MKKIGVVLGILLMLTSFGWAQKSKISVAVDGLSCSTPAGPGTFAATAWSFGAANTSDSSGGSGGAIVGKASVGDLNITKAFDPCSPALFGGVVTGKFYKSVTLTQTEKKDSDYLIVTLTNVLISSYQISGNQANEDPFESVSFNFAKICIFESSSGSKFCFDKTTNAGS
jgi:type VI protein secretion system component Hcp